MTRETVGRWAFAGAAAILLAGCSLPPGQFIIVQDQVPTDGCVIPAELSAIYKGDGILDVRLVRDNALAGYLVFPLLQNNLSPPEGESADPNRIALSGLNVQVTLPADAPDGAIKDLFNGLEAPQADGRPSPLVEFSVPTSGSVASGGGHTASSVDAVSAELARQIRNTGVLAKTPYIYITATVRALGSTLTGNVESDPFHFPIRVCDGCLVANLEVCPATHAAVNKGNACNVAQDEAVDCCDSGSGFICPPPVASQ